VLSYKNGWLYQYRTNTQGRWGAPDWPKSRSVGMDFPCLRNKSQKIKVLTSPNHRKMIFGFRLNGFSIFCMDLPIPPTGFQPKTRSVGCAPALLGVCATQGYLIDHRSCFKNSVGLLTPRRLLVLDLASPEAQFSPMSYYKSSQFSIMGPVYGRYEQTAPQTELFLKGF